MALLATSAFAQTAPQIRNGNFDPEQGGWPLGQHVTIEKDADARRGNVLVLRGAPGRSVKSEQEIQVDPSWAVLKFTYWVSVPEIKPGKESWHDARFTVTGIGGA